jgi:hypothetical protein
MGADARLIVGAYIAELPVVVRAAAALDCDEREAPG